MHDCKSWGLLALRLALAIVFIQHGYGKLFGGNPGMEAFTGMVAALGFPLPAIFAYAAALSEFVGGLALLVGAYTKIAGAFIGIVMLVALFGVQKFAFPSADVDLALLGGAVALFCLGGGRFSVMHYFGKGDCCGEGTCK